MKYSLNYSDIEKLDDHQFFLISYNNSCYSTTKVIIYILYSWYLSIIIFIVYDNNIYKHGRIVHVEVMNL